MQNNKQDNNDLSWQMVIDKGNRSKLSIVLMVILLLIGAFAIGFFLSVVFDGGENENEIPATYSSQQQDDGKSSKQPDVKPDKDTPDKEGVTDEQQALDTLGEEFIAQLEKEHPDVEWSFIIRNIDTGAEFMHNNKKMNSASVIKLFIMETVLKCEEEGSFELNDERKLDLNKMITESNNQASTNFIDAFQGYDQSKRWVTDKHQVNVTIKSSGYEYTELNRKMHDSTPPEGPSGYQNYTSVNDVANLYTRLYNGTLLDDKNTEYAMSLLKKQQRTSKIPSKIKTKHPDVIVANKTGELALVENDAAIIMGEDFNLVFVIMSESKTDTMDNSKVQATMGDLGLKLVDMYKNNDNF